MWKLRAESVDFLSLHGVSPLKTANNPDGGFALDFSASRFCPHTLLKRSYKCVLKCCT